MDKDISITKNAMIGMWKMIRSTKIEMMIIRNTEIDKWRMRRK